MKHFNNEAPALAEYAWEKGHSINWQKVSIMEQEPNLYAHQSPELYHVKGQVLSLNRDKGCLLPIYDLLLYR